MSGKTSLREMHASWGASVLPANCSQVQRQEMERAFYSGFRAVLLWQLHHAANLSDDEAVRQLDALHKESADYFETLRQANIDVSRS